MQAGGAIQAWEAGVDLRPTVEPAAVHHYALSVRFLALIAAVAHGAS